MPEKKLKFNCIFHIFLILTVLMMVFIFFQSSLPADVSSKESNVIAVFLADLLGVNPDPVSFIVRKCAHFLEYTILGIFIIITAGSCGKGGITWQKIIFVWIIGVIYAASDEFHQSFVPGRSCELRDILIDSCGVAAGILIIWLIRRKNQ